MRTNTHSAQHAGAPMTSISVDPSQNPYHEPKTQKFIKVMPKRYNSGSSPHYLTRKSVQQAHVSAGGAGSNDKKNNNMKRTKRLKDDENEMKQMKKNHGKEEVRRNEGTTTPSRGRSQSRPRASSTSRLKSSTAGTFLEEKTTSRNNKSSAPTRSSSSRSKSRSKSHTTRRRQRSSSRGNKNSKDTSEYDSSYRLVSYKKAITPTPQTKKFETATSAWLQASKVDGMVLTRSRSVPKIRFNLIRGEDNDHQPDEVNKTVSRNTKKLLLKEGNERKMLRESQRSLRMSALFDTSDDSSSLGVESVTDRVTVTSHNVAGYLTAGEARNKEDVQRTNHPPLQIEHEKEEGQCMSMVPFEASPGQAGPSPVDKNCVLVSSKITPKEGQPYTENRCVIVSPGAQPETATEKEGNGNQLVLHPDVARGQALHRAVAEKVGKETMNRQRGRGNGNDLAVVVKNSSSSNQRRRSKSMPPSTTRRSKSMPVSRKASSLNGSQDGTSSQQGSSQDKSSSSRTLRTRISSEHHIYSHNARAEQVRMETAHQLARVNKPRPMDMPQQISLEEKKVDNAAGTLATADAKKSTSKSDAKSSSNRTNRERQKKEERLPLPPTSSFSSEKTSKRTNKTTKPSKHNHKSHSAKKLGRQTQTHPKSIIPHKRRMSKSSRVYRKPQQRTIISSFGRRSTVQVSLDNNGKKASNKRTSASLRLKKKASKKKASSSSSSDDNDVGRHLARASAANNTWVKSRERMRVSSSKSPHFRGTRSTSRDRRLSSSFFRQSNNKKSHPHSSEKKQDHGETTNKANALKRTDSGILRTRSRSPSPLPLPPRRGSSYSNAKATTSRPRSLTPTRNESKSKPQSASTSTMQRSKSVPRRGRSSSTKKVEAHRLPSAKSFTYRLSLGAGDSPNNSRKARSTSAVAVDKNKVSRSSSGDAVEKNILMKRNSKSNVSKKSDQGVAKPSSPSKVSSARPKISSKDNEQKGDKKSASLVVSSSDNVDELKMTIYKTNIERYSNNTVGDVADPKQKQTIVRKESIVTIAKSGSTRLLIVKAAIDQTASKTGAECKALENEKGPEVVKKSHVEAISKKELNYKVGKESQGTPKSECVHAKEGDNVPASIKAKVKKRRKSKMEKRNDMRDPSPCGPMDPITSQVSRASDDSESSTRRMGEDPSECGNRKGKDPSPSRRRSGENRSSAKTKKRKDKSDGKNKMEPKPSSVNKSVKKPDPEASSNATSTSSSRGRAHDQTKPHHRRGRSLPSISIKKLTPRRHKSVPPKRQGKSRELPSASLFTHRPSNRGFKIKGMKAKLMKSFSAKTITNTEGQIQANQCERKQSKHLYRADSKSSGGTKKNVIVKSNKTVSESNSSSTRSKRLEPQSTDPSCLDSNEDSGNSKTVQLSITRSSSTSEKSRGSATLSSEEKAKRQRRMQERKKEVASKNFRQVKGILKPSGPSKRQRIPSRFHHKPQQQEPDPFVIYDQPSSLARTQRPWQAYARRAFGGNILVKELKVRLSNKPPPSIHTSPSHSSINNEKRVSDNPAKSSVISDADTGSTESSYASTVSSLSGCSVTKDQLRTHDNGPQNVDISKEVSKLLDIIKDPPTRVDPPSDGTKLGSRASEEVGISREVSRLLNIDSAKACKSV